MGYLDFTKQEATNLHEALKKEYVRTNRAGAYACSTILNCNTRKYHGLLVCPLPQIDNDNYVLLSNLDETVIQHNTPFNLAIHKYKTDFHPLGHKYIESYSNDPTPTHIYRVGGVILQKEIILVRNKTQVLIKYKLLKATSETTLQLRPLLAFRKVHELTRSNIFANPKHEKVTNGISSQLYDVFPKLHMQLSTKNEFITAPDWYCNFEYLKEKERGYECVEDLFTPGYFEFKIKEGETIVFSASLDVAKPKELPNIFEQELISRTPRNSFENCLNNAAQQFIYRHDNKTEIIASFPWSGSWGRDSMISLPGLTLAKGDFDTCEEVLNTFTKEITSPVYKNKGNIEQNNLESIDTAFWYIRSVQQYNWNTKDIAKTRKLFGKKVEEILEMYKAGVSNTVEMHDNGLLFLPSPHKALTWVDLKQNNLPVIPRWGYVVEINALWYNAICFALELINKKAFQDEWKLIPSRIEGAFQHIFWNESKKHLADMVAHNHYDFTVRPNQIFAASLPFSPLNDEQRNSILEVVRKELLTPKGIRTLSPVHPDFKHEIKGSIESRGYAYHQGGVVMWLLAPYCEAYLKLHGRSGVAEIKRIYTGLESEMKTHGIGSLSEVWDGNPPHEARGAIAQAWSVAAALRIKKLIENFESDTHIS